MEITAFEVKTIEGNNGERNWAMEAWPNPAFIATHEYCLHALQLVASEHHSQEMRLERLFDCSEENHPMLVAYDDKGLQIEEIPDDEIKIFAHQIASHDEALRILAEAEKQRPDVHWLIVKTGPWGVRGQI